MSWMELGPWLMRNVPESGTERVAIQGAKKRRIYSWC
nr:MAG TPA: hypothetical protein [Caudoviricetes sp.]